MWENLWGTEDNTRCTLQYLENARTYHQTSFNVNHKKYLYCKRIRLIKSHVTIHLKEALKYILKLKT